MSFLFFLYSNAFIVWIWTCSSAGLQATAHLLRQSQGPWAGTLSPEQEHKWKLGAWIKIDCAHRPKTLWRQTMTKMSRKKKHTKPTSLKNLRHRISHNLDPSPKIKFSHRDLDSAVFKLDCYPQSLAPVRRPNFSNPLRQDWWWFKLSPMGYPLINIEKAMETHHFYR